MSEYAVFIGFDLSFESGPLERGRTGNLLEEDQEELRRQ